MRAAVFIDGGQLRVLARQSRLPFDPDYIERFAHAFILPDESLLRVHYFDCAPFAGKVKLPVSGKDLEFKGNDRWLNELAGKDYFAVRRGVLKFRGFKPKKVPISPDKLTDLDFKPDFEQKGVDMRIGLDMASLSFSKIVDRIILVTADTDCIPAMKQSRISGLQIVLISLPGQHLAPELLWHSDMRRSIAFPSP